MWGPANDVNTFAYRAFVSGIDNPLCFLVLFRIITCERERERERCVWDLWVSRRGGGREGKGGEANGGLGGGLAWKLGNFKFFVLANLRLAVVVGRRRSRIGAMEHSSLVEGEGRG